MRALTSACFARSLPARANILPAKGAGAAGAWLEARISSPAAGSRRGAGSSPVAVESRPSAPPPARRRWKPASSRISIPSPRAFSSFEPGLSPTTSVVRLSADGADDPAAQRLNRGPPASSRVIAESVPVRTHAFPRKAWVRRVRERRRVRDRLRRPHGVNPGLAQLLDQRPVRGQKTSRTDSAMRGPTPSMAASASLVRRRQRQAVQDWGSARRGDRPCARRRAGCRARTPAVRGVLASNPRCPRSPGRPISSRVWRPREPRRAVRR